jgi:hypothetical protein
MMVGDESFGEASLPEPGTKIDASGSYINEFGICPLTCSFGHDVTDTIAVLLGGNDNPDPDYGILLGESVYSGPHSGV